MKIKTTDQAKKKATPWQEILTLDRNEELTPEQASQEFGYTRQTLYMWLRREGDDRLKGRKLSARKWRIRRGDLIEFLQSGNHREADDYQPSSDPALKSSLLHLITLAKAGLAWRQAHEIFKATAARVGDVSQDEWNFKTADQELISRCFDEAYERLDDLRALIGETSDEFLNDFQRAVEEGRISLMPGGKDELIFTLREEGERATMAESLAAH
jgi:hypothetical protein